MKKFNESKIINIFFSPLLFSGLLLIFCIFLVILIDKPLAWWIYKNGKFTYSFFKTYTDSLDNLLFGNLIYSNYQNMLGLDYLNFAIIRYFLLIFLFVFFYYGLKKPLTARLFIFIFFVHFFTALSTGILKFTIKRERPVELYQSQKYDLNFLKGQGDSFPSGHCADYFGFFLPLALGFQRVKWLILTIPILIALGRLLLYAHYLSDVLFSIGLAWFFCLIFGRFLKINMNITN